MQRVEEWRIGRADVEDHHVGRLGRAGIVADHRHVRRLNDRLASAHRKWRTVSKFERGPEIDPGRLVPNVDDRAQPSISKTKESNGATAR